jgi:uncharacterized PurR-regulated membrane protein YhhQ (DUF165 family)
VSTFESGVRAGRDAGATRFSAGVADVGPRAFRRSSELVGRAHVARPQADSVGLMGRALSAVMRLVVPVFLLLTVGAAAFLYGNQPVAWLGNIDIGGAPLSLGLVLLPLSFFVVHLTNRRYGAGYATAQVIGAWLVAFGSLPYTQNDLAMLHNGALPDMRLVAGFGSALFLAQLVSIFVFDRLRGPHWWQAPLFASLLGGVALCAIGYPFAYAGTDIAWTHPMLSYMGVAAAAAIVMVVPYWMLRSLVTPLSGFGGY